MTRFFELIASLCKEGETFTADVSNDWLQGRTTYGGLSAALCVAAAQQELGLSQPLRSAQFVFLGPVAGQVRLKLARLRTGKHSTFMAVDLTGEDGLAVRATLVFGASRPGTQPVRRVLAPPAESPDTCPDFFVGDGAPAFTRHFEAKQAGGSVLVSGAVEPTFLVWARHRDPAATGSLAALVALADMLPPPALALYERLVPISTITWALDFPGGDIPAFAHAWYLLQASAEALVDGYSTQSMALWDSDGIARLISRQHVAVFPPSGAKSSA